MRIENIEIYNYRSVKEIKLTFNDDVNVLVGPNGCGKTNILDAINTCFHAFLAEKKTIDKSEFYFGTKEIIEINISLGTLCGKLRDFLRFTIAKTVRKL